MMVLDTSGLFAAIDAGQRQHEEVRQALEADPGPFLLSPFVLAEIDYLLGTRVGVDAQLALLDEVARGAYQLESFGAEDVELAGRLVRRYRDLRIGLADASLVVLAERAGTNRILTLDERHFRALRSLRGRRLKLLPSDA
jgi:hypothetical protein